MWGLKETAPCFVAYATALSLLFQFPVPLHAFSKINASSASDSQLSSEVRSEKIKRLVRKGASSAQLREVADYVSELLAELHKRRKHNQRKINGKFQNEIGHIGYLFRQLGKTPKSNGPFGMSLRPELLYEWRLTEAITNSEPDQDPCQVICQFADNYQSPNKKLAWQYKKGQDANISGARQLEDSWTLPLFSLEAMFFSRVHGLCPKDHSSNLKTALSRWINHPYVKYREHQSSKNKYGKVLSASANQMRTWGMSFSNTVLKQILNNPALENFLPKTMKDEVSRGQLVVDRPYLERTLEQMEKGLGIAYGQRDSRHTSSKGNSNMHFHMLGTLLSTLSAKSGRTSTEALVKQIERLQSRSGASELQLPYTTDGRGPSSERSSAARAVPFRFAELKNIGNSPERLQRMVNALVNFAIHSGTLTIHVARNGVHNGGDGVAPYYWPPTLPTAAAALNLSEQLAKNAGNGGLLEKVRWAKNVFNRSITAQFDPKTGLFTNAGNATYGANPRAWVNAFQAVGLIPACEEKRGRLTMGAYDGLLEGEFLTAMKDAGPGPGGGIDPLRKLIGGTGKGGIGIEDKNRHETGRGKGKGKGRKAPPPKRETDTRTPAERLFAAFKKAKVDGGLIPFLDKYRASPSYQHFFLNAELLKSTLQITDEDDPAWLLFKTMLWPKKEPPPPARKFVKEVEPNNPILKIFSASRFSLKTTNQLRRQLESFREHVATEDWDGLQDALIDLLYSKTESQQEWLQKALGALSLDSSNDKESDAKIVGVLQKVLTAMQDRDKIGDPKIKAAISKRVDASFRWNKNLKSAIGNPKGIIAIELPDGKTERMKAKDWMNAQIKEFGYDNLVRFANSVGGDTGNRTLALLKSTAGNAEIEALHFSTGKKKVAVGSKDSAHSVAGDVRIRMSESKVPLTEQVQKYLPLDSPAWKNVEFFQPSEKRPVRISDKNDFVLHSSEEDKKLIAMRKSERKMLLDWLKRKKEAERRARRLKDNQGIQFDKRIAEFFRTHRDQIAQLFPGQLKLHDFDLESSLIRELEKLLDFPKNSLFDGGLTVEFARALDAKGNARYFFYSHLGNEQKSASIGMDDKGNYFIVDKPDYEGYTSDVRVPVIVAKKDGTAEKGMYFFGLDGIEMGEITEDKTKGQDLDFSFKLRGKFDSHIKKKNLLQTEFRYPGSQQTADFYLGVSPDITSWFGHNAPQETESDLNSKMEAHLRRFSKYPEIKELIKKKNLEELKMSLGIFEKDKRLPSLVRALDRLNRNHIPVPPMPEKKQKQQPPVPPKPEKKKERSPWKRKIAGIGSSKPGAGSDNRAEGKPGPRIIPQRKTPTPKKKKLSNADRAKYLKWMRDYENLSYIVRGRNLGKRERFTEAPFEDVPHGGTGKIILGYFANQDDKVLEREAAKHPLIEVRRYRWGSREQRNFRGIQAIGFDILGRKITRYGYSPRESLKSLVNSGEIQRAERYLEAKKALAGDSGDSHGSGSGGAGDRPRPSENAKNYHDIVTSSMRCARCHGRTHPDFPHFVKDWPTWESKLKAGDRTAKEWLQKFQNKVVHGSMLKNAGLDKWKHGSSGKAFNDFIHKQFNRYILGKKSAGTGGEKPNRAFMIDPAKKDTYLKLIQTANIDDKTIKGALQGFDAIWDHVGSPSWSWAPENGDAGKMGQRPVGIEPASPPRPHLFQKIGDKFRWREPFNLGFARDKNTKGLKSFFAIRFPRDENGKLIKGVRGKERYLGVHSRSNSSGYQEDVGRNAKGSGQYHLDYPWASFPKGTRVFEVLYTESYGEPVIIDVLTREKRITADGKNATWVPDILRADTSPERIRQWVKKQPNYQSNSDLQAILRAIDSPKKDGVRGNLGAFGNGVPFVIDGKRTNFIPGSKSVVTTKDKNILKRMRTELSLQSAAGSPGWALEEQGAFQGAHRGIRVDRNTCFVCHESAGEAFEDVFKRAKLGTSGVAAYGNMQGYDGVLSAPWFSREALKSYGDNAKITYAMRPEWGQFFEDYNKRKHLANRYRRTTRWRKGERVLTSEEEDPFR